MARVSLNRATLVGNLGADPVATKTNNGTSVARFSLATNERRKNADGKYEQAPEWHNVVAWGRLADTVEKYLKKGKSVFVEGRLQTRSWEQDGHKWNRRDKTEPVSPM